MNQKSRLAGWPSWHAVLVWSWQCLSTCGDPALTIILKQVLPAITRFHFVCYCQTFTYYFHDEVDMDHVGRTPTHHMSNLLPHLVPFYLLNQITFALNPDTSAQLRNRVDCWISLFEPGTARLEAVSTFLGSIMSPEKEGAPPRISWEVM